ncbi:MAG: acyltransferase [Planctomycetota bacterium]|nr:acyltransferase [Planctomycetota bacterium]
MSKEAPVDTTVPLTLAAAPKLRCIDQLRGLAALWVTLYHADGSFWRTSATLFDGKAADFFHTQPLAHIVSAFVFGLGYFGVPLFFIISGFCIHLPLAGNSRPLNVRAFAIRRFFRLYPLYITITALCMALYWIRDGWGHNPQLTFGSVIGHLFFWHYFASPPDPGMGVSPVLWTLSLEVEFYILYALLLPLLRRIGFGRCALIGIVIGIAYRTVWYSNSSLDPHWDEQWPRIFYPSRFVFIRFGEWLLGAWLAELYARRSPTGIIRFPWSNPALLAGGCFCIIFGVAFAIFCGLDRYATDLLASVGFALITLVAIRADAASQAKGPTPVSWWQRLGTFLGDRSYSLYLIHFSAIVTTVEVVARLAHVAARKDSMGGTPVWLLAVCLGTAMAFIGAEFTYRFIEAPSHEFARKLVRRFEQRSVRLATARADPVTAHQ